MKPPHYPHLLLLLFLLSLSACQNDSPDETRQPRQTIDLEDDTVGVKEPGNSPGLKEDYTHTNRVIWQKPDLVINTLGEVNDKTIADIGAGTGFFAIRLAPKAKKVIAIDIDPRFISYLDSVKVLELPEHIQSKLETRLARPDDPMLGPAEADIVMIVNTFMYIKNQVQYLKNLKEGISKGGRLLIVDFKKKRTPIGPPAEIRIPLYRVEEMLYEAGYGNVITNDTGLDYQYIVIAER